MFLRKSPNVGQIIEGCFLTLTHDLFAIEFSVYQAQSEWHYKCNAEYFCLCMQP